LRVEPCLLLAAAPLLMFPGCLTPVILPLLILPWLGRRLILGRYTARTLLDWPIVVLIGVLPISMRMSWDPLHSLPKLSGIALGVLAFYALVNHVLLPRQVWIVGLGMAASGLAVSLLALVGTDWHVHWLTQKWFIPKEVYDYLPRLITGVAGSSAESGFHPNQVGAALCLFIPFTAAQLLLALPRHSRLHSPGDDHAHAHSETAGVRHRVLRGLLAVALTIMCFTALLTGARSALLGVGAGLLTVAWFRGRWFLGLMLLLGLLACGLLGHYVGSERLIGEGLAPSLAREIGWRLEIWQTALSMIRDQPWTGVGLNSFPLVANVRYPLTSFTPEEVLRLTHSHNVFLQVGVDLGIPGLVAYCALLMGFGASWWLTYKHSKELRLRAASVGLLAGMIAYHFCGLFDCMTLGAKPGVAIWAILGLMAALANLSSTDRAAPAGEEARSA